MNYLDTNEPIGDATFFERECLQWLKEYIDPDATVEESMLIVANYPNLEKDRCQLRVKITKPWPMVEQLSVPTRRFNLFRGEYGKEYAEKFLKVIAQRKKEESHAFTDALLLGRNNEYQPPILIPRSLKHDKPGRKPDETYDQAYAELEAQGQTLVPFKLVK